MTEFSLTASLLRNPDFKMGTKRGRKWDKSPEGAPLSGYIKLIELYADPKDLDFELFWSEIRPHDFHSDLALGILFIRN